VIIDKKELQSALAALAKLPEYNPGPVLQIDIEGNIVLANQAARNLFGTEALAGLSWFEVCPGASHSDWNEITESTGPVAHEAVIGEHIFTFTFVRSDEADIVYVYGNDETAIRKAQHELAAQAAQLREVARFPEMNPGPVLRLDMSGNVLLANAAARKILGENIVRYSWKATLPGMDDGLWNRIISSAEPIPIEARVANGDYVFSHRYDHQSQLVFVFGSDITYQKNTERALIQSEKMATLGTLAAGVAHELNNPAAATRRAAKHLEQAFATVQNAHLRLDTTMISVERQQMMRELEDLARTSANRISELDPLTRSDKEQQLEEWLDDHSIPDAYDLAPSLVGMTVDLKRLSRMQGVFADSFHALLQWLTGLYQVFTLSNEINQGSSRISEIVGALKNYSYLGQAPVQAVNIHEGIDNTLVILRNKLKRGINVKREYSVELPTIMAYGSELNQVWTNLLDNATDAMNGNGEITIETYRDGNFVVVEIEDNGPGIPIEIQSRIFDPFFTTKEPGKGTGLGLATTYGIVTEKHAGKIEVKSRPGSTTFIVRLPIDGVKAQTPSTQ